MSHWVRFCSSCPISNCPGRYKIHYWVHTKDDCELDINEEGYIKCRKSGCSLNENPCFILDFIFCCKNHSEHKRADKMSIFNAISIASSGELGLSDEECKKLLIKILNY